MKIGIGSEVMDMIQQIKLLYLEFQQLQRDANHQALSIIISIPHSKSNLHLLNIISIVNVMKNDNYSDYDR